MRVKEGKKLEISLVTQNTYEYSQVASELQRQWEKMGIALKVDLVNEQDLQQNHIAPHQYDILLYGVSLGTDPDVYAYWHSREAGLGGFNLSEYKNTAVDTSLEGGRTRSDATQRAIKYRGFLEAWRKDIPAIALYQPSFDYIQSSATDGFTPHTLVSPADRFSDVVNWRVLERVKDR
jgi:peptide/nickel transport system substrate-binding protein